jgi:hypothetical protein
MAKRLQLILEDFEYREIQRMAHTRRISISEWVRQALASARRPEPSVDVVRKLEAIRVAAQHCYPVPPDIY